MPDTSADDDATRRKAQDSCELNPDMVFDPRTGAYVLPEYLNDPEINPGCDLNTGLRWRLDHE